eukprot:scaffold2774_cov87-Phaeocystis_antarctica.AAC.3
MPPSGWCYRDSPRLRAIVTVGGSVDPLRETGEQSRKAQASALSLDGRRVGELAITQRDAPRRPSRAPLVGRPPPTSRAPQPPPARPSTAPPPRDAASRTPSTSAPTTSSRRTPTRSAGAGTAPPAQSGMESERRSGPACGWAVSQRSARTPGAMHSTSPPRFRLATSECLPPLQRDDSSAVRPTRGSAENNLAVAPVRSTLSRLTKCP